jgi:hypothetical protein
MDATKTKTYAVLIADIAESSSTPQLSSVLARKLRSVSQAHVAEKRVGLPYAITAGDEFQTLVLRLDTIPSLVFDLRVRFRPLDLWIGVGIGDIAGPIVEPVNRLTGEAFVLARQALESIKGAKGHKFGALTAFHTTNERFDLVANALYRLHDTLVQSISGKQWRTIEVYVKKCRVDATAKALGINVSTVSRNLRRGYYWQMRETVENVRRIIGAYFL